MKQYKLVIYDFDGTLFSTHEAIIHCVNKTFEAYQRPLPSREDIYETITKGMALHDSFNLLDTNSQKSSEEILQWIDVYREFYHRDGDAKTEPYDNVKDILHYTQSTGATNVIISNKGPRAIHSSLEKYELKQYITLVVGDTPGMKKKPDPMIFNEIIRHQFNEINSHEILVIGDTPADLLFAKNIGADGCWVTYGYGVPEECERIVPTYTVNHLSEIKGIV